MNIHLFNSLTTSTRCSSLQWIITEYCFWGNYVQFSWYSGSFSYHISQREHVANHSLWWDEHINIHQGKLQSANCSYEKPKIQQALKYSSGNLYSATTPSSEEWTISLFSLRRNNLLALDQACIPMKQNTNTGVFEAFQTYSLN